jgi:hypothetical protein
MKAAAGLAQEARAVNKRLREALERIADRQYSYTREYMRKLARAALSPTPSEPEE